MRQNVRCFILTQGVVEPGITYRLSGTPFRALFERYDTI